MSYYEKYVKAYQKTPKGRFVTQKANAQRRDIPWELTFEQWWQLWKESGKWEQRGRTYGCYVMARLNDEGPYALGNVRIILHQKNSKEAYSHGLGLKY